MSQRNKTLEKYYGTAADFIWLKKSVKEINICDKHRKNIVFLCSYSEDNIICEIRVCHSRDYESYSLLRS